MSAPYEGPAIVPVGEPQEREIRLDRNPGVTTRDRGHGVTEVTVDLSDESLFPVPREERREHVSGAPGYTTVEVSIPSKEHPIRKPPKPGEAERPEPHGFTPAQLRENVEAKNEARARERIERAAAEIRADLTRAGLQAEHAQLTRKIRDFVRRSPRKR